MASQSRYSLLTVSGLTPTFASYDVQGVGVQTTGRVVGSGLAEAVTTELVEDGMPLAALSRSLSAKSTKKEDLLKLSREGRPYPIPASEGNEGGWVFTEEALQRLPWAKLFATGPEEALEN